MIGALEDGWQKCWQFDMDSSCNSTSSFLSWGSKFKMPVEFVPDARQLQPETAAEHGLPDMYEQLFCPHTDQLAFGTKERRSFLREQMPFWYTNNRRFLCQTQKLVRRFRDVSPVENTDKIAEIVREVSETDSSGFCEKMQFFDWGPIQSLNASPMAMAAVKLYQVAAPLMYLVLPVLVIIVPLLACLCGFAPCNVSGYLDLLYRVAMSQKGVANFVQFWDLSDRERLTTVVSGFVFAINVYQSCRSFWIMLQNCHLILGRFRDIATYCQDTCRRFSAVRDALGDGCTTYAPFCEAMGCQLWVLETYSKKLSTASNGGVLHTGSLFSAYWELHASRDVREAFEWSFGFNSWCDTIKTLKSLSKTKLSRARFVSNIKEAQFEGLSHPSCHPNEVQNNADFAKPVTIVTGRNASGKTTHIKAAFVAQLMVQQTGFGPFTGGAVYLFDQLHSYLNIPDTNDRDSLFEAECRRCLEIVRAIDAGGTHFCMLDELYSGTNPTDAVDCSQALVRYLASRDGVACMLTTHYTDVCDILKDHKGVNLMKMGEGYKVLPGVSRVCGGAAVLRRLEYPAAVTSLLRSGTDFALSGA